MSLIIALGSNLGDKKSHLKKAIEELSQPFHHIASSRIFHSGAIEYLDQPDFYNMVAEFKIPEQNPIETMEVCLGIEQQMGRRRDIPKGPRIIDIDILFWGTETYELENVSIPHPRWFERSFVVRPLQELPYYETLRNHYKIPTDFSNKAEPIKG